MKRASLKAIEWVAMMLVCLIPLDSLRAVERAINRELLRRELHRIGGR